MVFDQNRDGGYGPEFVQYLILRQVCLASSKGLSSELGLGSEFFCIAIVITCRNIWSRPIPVVAPAGGYEMVERIAEAPPRFKGRVAGGLYFFSLLTAAFGETSLHGRLAVAVGLIAVAGMVALTVLLYFIFKPVNRSLSLLAAFVNVVGLSFEALRWNPRGLDIALVFTGAYCILIGYLIFRSTFLPRILGALVAFGGLAWLTYLSRSLAHDLSPYNVVFGILGEALLCLWLLVIGVNVQRWKEQASAAGSIGT
jgi:hypothetical protein